MRNLEKHPIKLALTFGIAPKTFCPFVDSQDLQIQYTTEYENDNKELNFSDINHLDKLNHFHDFAGGRKTLTMNVQIKPHCNICPNMTLKVFKGVLLRALYIC